MARLIAHLDADCFYVSAERVRDSFLVDKPVGVLGNQGACVIAKSYEMKASGVKTGEPIWEAIGKCPDGLYVKRDFRWYEVISKEMLRLVREASPLVEYYSVDEFFLAVDSKDPQRFADEIRERILSIVGVPVTIGIARTKSIAKLVSDTAKPFGSSAIIGEQAEHELLANRDVSEITGIGGRRAATLYAYGIRSCLDFARARPALIRKLLTVVGERLCYELQGYQAVPLLTNRPPHKEVSRGGSIGGPSADPEVQWAWAIRNLERLVEALELHQVYASRLKMLIDYKDGPSTAAEASLEVPTRRFDLLLVAARYLWPRVTLKDGRLYRMHFIASDLQYAGQRQLCLFTPPEPSDDALRAAKEAINARHGRFALRSAATLPLSEIYIDDAHNYEICDIAGKTCF